MTTSNEQEVWWGTSRRFLSLAVARQVFALGSMTYFLNSSIAVSNGGRSQLYALSQEEARPAWVGPIEPWTRKVWKGRQPTWHAP